MAELDISSLRKSIDACDQKIIELFRERFHYCRQVERTKGIQNRDAGQEHRSMARLDREAEILKDVIGGLITQDAPLKSAIQAVYREIISQSLAFEQPQQIVFLGPHGTYSEQCARQIFGTGAEYHIAPTIGDIFSKVESDSAHWGVVPYENSTEGSVNAAIDLLANHPDLQICSEMPLAIHLCLLSARGASANQIKAVDIIYGHPQALAQSRLYLEHNFPKAHLEAVASNGLAAQMVQERTDALAVGSSQAAEYYDLDIVDSNIEDTAGNSTRFVVIGKISTPATGDDRTSILLSMASQSGALSRALQPFEQKNINMTMLVSRPNNVERWKYNFYVDFQGHRDDPNVQELLAAITETGTAVRILGSYPRHESL